MSEIDVQVADLVRELDHTKDDVAFLRAANQAFEAEVARLSVFEARVSELEKELEDVKEESDERSRLASKYGTERDEARMRAEEAHEALSQAKVVISKAEKKAADRSDKIKELEAVVEARDAEIRVLKDRLDAFDPFLDQVRAAFNALP